MDTTRLTVVSNRLAIVVDHDQNDQWTIKPAAGGLVTALGPVLRDRGGQWIGWIGGGSDHASMKCSEIELRYPSAGVRYNDTTAQRMPKCRIDLVVSSCRCGKLDH